VSRANYALLQAKQAINQANEAGARLFATALFDEAIRLRDVALVNRRQREWALCHRNATTAWGKAGEAFETADQAREVSAEAVLSDRRGEVNRRKPKDLVWLTAQLDAVLIEEEKVRTLSGSSAEILFRDDSRLRLGENSQAVIQRMRVDLLTKKEEARVSLVTGDVYALLGGGAKQSRKAFTLDVPGVDTRIESRNFWASNDGRVSRFANYDSGQIQVRSENATAILHKNQGPLIRRGQAPGPTQALLPPPRLQAPADQDQIQGEQVILTWQTVDEAVAYFLEVATDPAFSRLVVNKSDLLSTRFPFTKLDHGAWFRHVTEVEPEAGGKTAFPVSRVAGGKYYWRVAAVDRLGLPGAHSKAREFLVHRDLDAPYLMILSPKDRSVVYEDSVLIRGEAEPGATLTLNGQPVTLDADGRFSLQHPLLEGDNSVVLELTDRAGRVSRRQRLVSLRTDRSAPIRYADDLARLESGHFVSRAAVFPLAGSAGADSRLSVRSENGSQRLATQTNADGHYQLNLPLFSDHNAFTIEVRSPAGAVVEDRFEVVRDRQPPTIRFEQLPPGAVNDPQFRLTGLAEGAQRLSINGQDIALDATQRFSQVFALQPGATPFRVSASDAAGNIALAQFEVRLDNSPPAVGGHSLKSLRGKNGTRVRLTVRVTDASAMRRNAPFEIAVAGKVYHGYLEWDAAAKHYSGAVSVDAPKREKPRLRSVDLEDELGNRLHYTGQ
jgi:hypothetical protein